MSKSQTSFRRRLLRAGIATAVVAAGVTTATAPALAATPALTLSAASGPGNAATAVTGSSTTAWLSGVTPAYTDVQMNTATCPTTYSAASGSVLDGGTVTKISNYKAAFSVPTTGSVVTSITKYNVCIYASAAGTTLTTTDPLVATATFSYVPLLTITSVTPASGPTSGGNTITVNGTNLPTSLASYLNVTVDGLPVTNITPVSATSFTATAPAHPTATANVTVGVSTTNAGNNKKTSAYSYLNGITVTPNFGAYNTNTSIDITGIGFSALTFGALNTSGKAHVFLVDGAYNSTWASLKPATECPSTSVIQVSDTEIICTVTLVNDVTVAGAVDAANAGVNPVARGAYTVTVVADDQLTASTPAPTAISSSATFTVADF